MPCTGIRVRTQLHFILCQIFRYIHILSDFSDIFLHNPIQPDRDFNSFFQWCKKHCTMCKILPTGKFHCIAQCVILSHTNHSFLCTIHSTCAMSEMESALLREGTLLPSLRQPQRSYRWWEAGPSCKKKTPSFPSIMALQQLSKFA